MIGTWLFMLGGGATIWIWLDALRAREHAIHHGRQLCREAGVQLLDQSVSLRRLRVARRRGLLTLVRRYSFDVSLDGSDRHRAYLELAGHRLETWSLPLRQAEQHPAAIGEPQRILS